ncbi:mechanosensitive ion channel family protein [Stieleria sp. TO1_6]|uniref:mechanosensitive ion channel family protein n=1 Tax=Stieleria tagensis TaxID=2956795 RepID=UPI00209B27EE|nr:mechanosensitive ion channel family protein [Stieleria tagensis]MCO8123492.1 mechanosensitive ion channel family protein [Stieleria tagensis]
MTDPSRALAIHPRSLVAMLLLVVIMQATAPVIGQEFKPLKPADTSSPRATLRSFRDDMNAMYRLLADPEGQKSSIELTTHRSRAVRCLDLTSIDVADPQDMGRQRAVMLMEIFDRIGIDIETVPGADDVAEKEIRRWLLPDTEIAIEQLSEGPRSGQFLFASDTVARIPEFHDRVKHLPYKPGTVMEDAFEKLFSVASPAVEPNHPLEPADTTSPRGTLKSFIDSMNDIYRSYRDDGNTPEAFAARQLPMARVRDCLDLSEVPPASQLPTLRETAVLLKEVFDRIEIPPFDLIPGPNQVSATNLDQWSIPNTEISIARVSAGPDTGRFRFSPQTLRHMKTYYERVENLPYKETPLIANAYDVYFQLPGPIVPASWIESLPDWMHGRLGRQPIWKWTSIAMIWILLVSLLGLTFRLCVGRRSKNRLVEFLISIVFPASGMLFVWLAKFSVDVLRVDQNVYLICSMLFTLMFAFLTTWLAVKILPGIGEWIIASPHINSQSLDAQVVRVIFQLASVAALVAIVLKTADLLGVPLTPVVAGLGVGGLAVALATQNSLENLVGGFSLFVDRPIRVGDFCRFGDRLGTVEQIGLRSTRVRTLEDTVVSIPNATFARMELENFAKRRRNWYHPRIELAKDSTPDQIRVALIEIRKVLYAHPKVDPNPARIRFLGFGDSSLNLDIFAFTTTPDFDEHLQISEDLNLRILEVLSRIGVSLAVPTTKTLVQRCDPPGNENVRRAKEQVRDWRAKKEMLLPSFPEEEIDRLRQTADYPPNGSAIRVDSPVLCE